MHDSINYLIAFAVGFLASHIAITLPYVIKAWAIRKNLEALGDGEVDESYLPLDDVQLDPEDEKAREAEEEELNRFFG